MSIETSSSSSRRTVLAGAIGGAVAFAAHALGRPQAASATHESYVQLSHINTNSTATSIGHASGSGNASFALTDAGVSAAGNLFGVNGTTGGVSGNGVQGTLTALATSGIAVQGNTTGHHSQVAVDGNATNGVGEGIGVRGRTKNGIGVYAEATGGYALQAVGRTVFSRSGKATIAGGNSTKTISGFTIVPATVVVATIQGNPPGVWVRNVSLSDANDTFTIRLNKAAPSGGVTVGFFIVN